ncbi:uncharacterized protein LOC141649525 [Silene latifolia]|uniref:uncharacterized protein LOC141649525 n=1 Tax=Silene latifolia TaxID=37657 RepID=UPI003D7719EA
MEYLSRVLEFSTDKWFFRYHSLCKSLKLTHLLFDDDLLMFCKGDVQSIMLMLRALATFSATSGLRVNSAKSEVVFNGVAPGLKHDITEISGFTEGRLVLINSVFNTLHNYWASIFLIPKGVIKRIEAIWRNYLWSGDTKYHRTPLVAWHDVCSGKKEGVWDHVHMKGVDWDSYQPPQDSNWNWRNICKVRGILSGGFQGNQWVADPKGYSIGAGYQWLQGPHPPVDWYKDVWKGWNVPKQAFIAWLVCRKALNTRVNLLQMGVTVNDNCVLCEGGPENHCHLYIDCIYSQQVLAGLENWLQRKLTVNPGDCSKLQYQVIKSIQKQVQGRVKQKSKEIVQARYRQWLVSIGIHVM